MRFLCYTIYSKNPDTKEPLGYCALGEGRVISAITLDILKQNVLMEYPLAEFLEDCGWILSGEEMALLDPNNQDSLAYMLKLKHPDLASY